MGHERQVRFVGHERHVGIDQLSPTMIDELSRMYSSQFQCEFLKIITDLLSDGHSRF